VNDYFEGAVRQLLKRGETLLASIKPRLTSEFYLLEQACRKKLTEVMSDLHALIEDPQMQKPQFQPLRLRKYRRLIESLDLLETCIVPALSRAQESDSFLNRVVQQIRSEINYPLLPPVVSPFSQNYFYILEEFNLICVHLGEGNFLLHLSDIYHELAHPLVWEKGYPAIRPYQISLIESLDEVRSWLYDELERQRRGRGPDRYEFNIRQWIKSWEDWCIEFYCDLFATFTLGPAFAWSHFHLCATRGGNPFDIPLLSVTTHPADDARMEAILDGLCLIGFSREAANIERRWERLIEASGFSPEPEYKRCFPKRILKLLSEKALAGVEALGCRIASDETNDLVHNALNQAWIEFWHAPREYVVKERKLVEALRKQLSATHSVAI
jgi:hypothetical protein